MKKSTISKQWSNTTDLFSTLAVKSHKLSMLWLMLFTLLLVPTSMVAETTTEDPRYVLFKGLEGITDVTITDNGNYPWRMLDSNAEGMQDLGFTIPEGSKGLMSSNYKVDKSSSETVIRFNVSKPILLTSQVLVSSEFNFDIATITLDNKESWNISGIKQKEIKALLSVGEHSLKLSYNKDGSTNEGADRAFIYGLETATTISDYVYVAESDATNTTLTFKKFIDANISDIGNNSVIVEQYKNVKEICTALGNVTIKNIVFDESFKTYAPTSLKEFFYNCTSLETISGLEYLNTANVTDMGNMFLNCNNLKSLDLTKFNTEKVTDMNAMFQNCRTLKSLDLTKLNTEQVTNMNSMFLACRALESLDLTKLNTAKVTDMSFMFDQCYDLTTIYASDNFKTEKVEKSDLMFMQCFKLKGFIEYSKDKTDHQYANYKTGYFTKLVVKNGDERYGITGETTQFTVDNLALDDDKDFVAYEPFTATTATYNRDIKAGTTWATLCLPFEVSLDGKNFRAFKLLSANETTNTVELEEITTTIEAGMPVIIKMTNGETALNVSEANKSIVKAALTSATANNDYQLQGIYTKKVFDKAADNNCYIVKGDKLMNPAKLLVKTSTTQVGSKPFRAYMVDNSSAPTAGAKMFSIGFDNDGTTAIDNLNTIADDKAEYYDLQGNRLNEPQKGINIVKRNGKTMKVIIK